MTLSQRSIFISYRRSDSIDVTGRIYDRLIAHYGKASIFKDVDSIPYGSDFRDHIRHWVDQCKVMIAVIGPTWLEAEGQSRSRRIDNAKDWVRVEIEAALERDITLIPLLVKNADLPGAIALPKSLQAMVYRNCAQARPDPDFHHDLDRLLRNLDQILGGHQLDSTPRLLSQHSRLSTLKAKYIEERLSTLSEDYRALSAQQSYVENAVSKNNLKRQKLLLEEEIEKLETKLIDLHNHH